MANQWFKFYGGEFLSDPKIERLSPVERSCWITLMCLASMSSEGIVEFLTVETLLNKSGIQYDPYHPEEWEKALSVLSKFQKMKMISLDKEGEIILTNWDKRQERTAQTPYERVKKHRENKKKIENDNGNDNGDNENDNDRIEENRREEKDIVVKNDNPYNFKEEIQKLENHARRDLNIIALYFDVRKPDLQTRAQFNKALARHVKAAGALKPFTDNQILKAVDYAKKEYKDIWTLETLSKILTK